MYVDDVLCTNLIKAVCLSVCLSVCLINVNINVVREQCKNSKFQKTKDKNINSKNYTHCNTTKYPDVCYQAYRKWVESVGKEEPRLPGVTLSHDQLFFLNFAQVSSFVKRTFAKMTIQMYVQNLLYSS